MKHYTKSQQIKDLREMIEADRAHMHKALEEEKYLAADRFLHSVMDRQAELAKLIGG